MTDKTPDLSRRKLLGSMATLGGAAVIGGAGSMAFFSDRETFANNQLVAGALDLKVDWEEHYSDWSDDEVDGIEWSMTDSSVGPGFPSAAPEKFVYVSDAQKFLANTAIEAFPDANNDGQQNAPSGFDICEYDADLDAVLSDPLRTDNTIGGEPNPQTTEPGDPLVAISDVKPGDFGEVTLSFHLCGNPGFVWLTGDLVGAAENGLTEPERKDGDEDGDADSTDPADVELLDAISAALWYDTGDDGSYGTGDVGEGDNYHQSEEAFIPLTGSLRDVLMQLEEAMVPLDYTPVPTTGENGSLNIDATSTVSGDQGNPDFTGQELIGSTSNISCASLGTLLDPERELVGTKISGGALQEGNWTAGSGGTISVESVNVSDVTITLSTNFPIQAVMIKSGAQAGGENIWVYPTDGVLLSGASYTVDQAISHLEVCYAPGADPQNGDGGAPGQQVGRQCFPNSTTAYVGFEWWLPVDHANEIQTDSVTFDLGFYTEQCRHNDGILGNREI